MNRPLRVMIGSPCGGGVVTVQYLLSFLETQNNLNAYNSNPKCPRRIDIALYTLANESLISRGRNHIAAVALMGKYDKLFFIDADAGWTFNQFMAIATSDKDIIAGVCPLKVYPIHLNFEANKEDLKLFTDNHRSIESLGKLRAHYGKSECPVRYVGTAFQMYDVAKVLMPMAEIADSYRYPNPQTGQLETHWDFFDTTPVNKYCMSEDYGFINKARSLGIEPWINADVVITHTGSHCFRADIPPSPLSQQRTFDSKKANQ